MATIKSYTDYPQSKVLSKILSDESADMFWKNGVPDKYIQCFTPFVRDDTNMDYDYDVPCWSLAVLLDVLPVGTESHKQSDGSISYYHVEVYNNKKYFSTKRYNNLIDACYEMIIKLHELKML